MAAEYNTKHFSFSWDIERWIIAEHIRLFICFIRQDKSQFTHFEIKSRGQQTPGLVKEAAPMDPGNNQQGRNKPNQLNYASVSRMLRDI